MIPSIGEKATAMDYARARARGRTPMHFERVRATAMIDTDNSTVALQMTKPTSAFACAPLIVAAQMSGRGFEGGVGYSIVEALRMLRPYRLVAPRSPPPSPCVPSYM